MEAEQRAPESSRETEPVDVLMVEDNPGDARLARGAFDALDRLRSGDVPSPTLVLLDLDLPGLDGLSVLRALKPAPTLPHVPVVIFSSSEAPADVRRMYTSHANAYVPKPADAEQFSRTSRRLAAFWLSTAALPGGEAS